METHIEKKITEIKDNIKNIYINNGYNYNFNCNYDERNSIKELNNDTLESELDIINEMTDKQTKKLLENSWNKCTKHVKKISNRIFHQLQVEYNLDLKQLEDLKNLLLKGLRELMITKKAVDYDIENKKILKINILEFKDDKLLNYDSRNI